MPFEPGKSGNPEGRPKGTPNVLTRTVRQAVLDAFNAIQEDENHNLAWFAEKYPRDFYAIAAKLIPTEIAAKVDATVKTVQFELDDRYKDSDDAGIPA